MSRFIIYGLEDPRTGQIRYVGRSSSGLERPKHHTVPAALAKEPNRHKASWLRGLVAEGKKPTIRVLEAFESGDDLTSAERFWIAQAKGLAWPLTNLTDGGEGLLGRKHSAETKAKIGAGNKGKIISQAARDAMRAKSLGRKHTPEARDKMSAQRAGRRLSPEHIAAAAAGQTGRRVTAETRAKISAANKAHWANLSPEERAAWLSRRAASDGRFK